MLTLLYTFTLLLVISGIVLLPLTMPAHRRQLGMSAEASWLRRGRQLAWGLVVAGLVLATLCGNGMVLLTVLMTAGLLMILLALGLSVYS